LEKVENKIIQILLAIGIPFLCFVFCWWFAGFLLKSGLIALADREIACAALFGLFIGILITIFYLKRLTFQFYQINYWILFIIYLFISAIAFAMFMGFPIGTLVLGAFSGFYIGRRSKHNRIPYMSFSKTARKLSLFNVLFIGTSSFMIGCLALKETNLLAFIQKFFWLKPAFFTGYSGILFVTFLTIILMFFQFWITWKSAILAYR
jgi:hypothetical protein